MANVEIYTKETCPYCHRAKALLSSKGVSFQELPIDGNAAKREEMIKRSGRTTVPQIFIDAQHIGELFLHVQKNHIVGPDQSPAFDTSVLPPT